MGIKRLIEQAYHRNGVSGHGAVISLFEVEDESGTFVGVTLSPDMDESLTPNDYQIQHASSLKDAYVKQWLDRFATDTVVLSVEETAKGNIAFAEGNSWRGADNYGPALAQAWREKCLSETRFGMSGYDPALEWYEDQNPEPQPKYIEVAPGVWVPEDLVAQVVHGDEP